MGTQSQLLWNTISERTFSAPDQEFSCYSSVWARQDFLEVSTFNPSRFSGQNPLSSRTRMGMASNSHFPANIIHEDYYQEVSSSKADDNTQSLPENGGREGMVGRGHLQNLMHPLHVQSGRALALQPDHLLRPPFLVDPIDDLFGHPCAANFYLRLRPYRQVPQPPQLRLRQRQLGQRGPALLPASRRRLRRLSAALPLLPGKKDLPLLRQVPRQPSPGVGKDPVLSVEDVFHGAPLRRRLVRPLGDPLVDVAESLEFLHNPLHRAAPSAPARPHLLIVAGEAPPVVQGGLGPPAEAPEAASPPLLHPLRRPPGEVPGTGFFPPAGLSWRWGGGGGGAVGMADKVREAPAGLYAGDGGAEGVDEEEGGGGGRRRSSAGGGAGAGMELAGGGGEGPHHHF